MPSDSGNATPERAVFGPFLRLLRLILNFGNVRHTLRHIMTSLWLYSKRRYAAAKRRTGRRKPDSDNAGTGGTTRNRNLVSPESKSDTVYSSNDAGPYLVVSNDQHQGIRNLPSNYGPGLPAPNHTGSRSSPALHLGSHNHHDQFTISVQTASTSRLSVPYSVQDREDRASTTGRRSLLRASGSRSSSRASSRASAHPFSRAAMPPPKGSSRSRPETRSHSNRSRMSVVSANYPPSTHSSMKSGLPVDLAEPSRDISYAPSAQLESLLTPTYPILKTHRYERDDTLTTYDIDWTVPAMEMSYNLKGIPEGWLALTHPEGQLYFFNGQRRIYTDAYICDPAIFSQIEEFAASLDYMRREEKIEIPQDADLVLELEKSMKHPGRINWCYYYADHTSRTLFWLQEYTVTDDLDEMKGIASETHIKLALEEFYWLHWDTFPYNHEPTDDLRKGIMGMLTHASLDQITSRQSTYLYSADELHKMLTFVKGAKDFPDSQHATCVIGRLMHIFAHHRFLNYYGQRVSRLRWNQSLFGDQAPRSPLITVLSPFLFNAPETHLAALERIWTDRIINHVPWSSFINKLQTEWQEYILFSTVVLNANISFMTINDVDPGTGPRTSAQVTSFVSTIASIGSILVGLLLVRRYRLKPIDTAMDAATYLNSRTHPKLGLETLAIIYSLPYALLMWGMVSFLVAFAFECFVEHDSKSTIVSAVAWGLVGMFIMWSIYTIWDGVNMAIVGALTSFRSHIHKKLQIFPYCRENTSYSDNP